VKKERSLLSIFWSLSSVRKRCQEEWTSLDRHIADENKDLRLSAGGEGTVSIKGVGSKMRRGPMLRVKIAKSTYNRNSRKRPSQKKRGVNWRGHKEETTKMSAYIGIFVLKSR